MGSVGPMEVMVILVVALLVLGPNKLPEAARQVGKAVAEFRRVTGDLQAEVRDAFTEPTASPNGSYSPPSGTYASPVEEATTPADPAVSPDDPHPAPDVEQAALPPAATPADDQPTNGQA